MREKRWFIIRVDRNGSAEIITAFYDSFIEAKDIYDTLNAEGLEICETVFGLDFEAIASELVVPPITGEQLFTRHQFHFTNDGYKWNQISQLDRDRWNLVAKDLDSHA